MRRPKTTAKHERDIGDESADSWDRWRAIMAITFDRRYEYEPLIRSFLDHPDHIIRAEAMNRLLYVWGRADLLDRAIEMALSDPDEYARVQIIGALQGFGSHYPIDEKVKRRIVTALVRVLRQDSDEVNQVSAYAGILELLDGVKDYSPDHWDRETDVDWERLREFEGGEG